MEYNLPFLLENRAYVGPKKNDFFLKHNYHVRNLKLVDLFFGYVTLL